MKHLIKIALASSFLLVFGNSAFAQKTGQTGESDQLTEEFHQDRSIRSTILELDRLQIDAKRQLELLNTLVEITQSINAIRPYGESMLALLDESRSIEERWQKVLTTPIETNLQEDIAESAWVNALEEELLKLKDQVALLSAELAVLHGAPPLPIVETPRNHGDSLEDEIRNWQLDVSQIRYAQTSEVGVKPAVWLDMPTGGTQLDVGASVQIGNRTVRLDKLDKRLDGRIRLLFNLDGQPVSIDW